MKRNFGTKIGECPVCEINLWDSTGGKPAIMPCNVARPGQPCPWEPDGPKPLTAIELSGIGNALAQIE